MLDEAFFHSIAEQTKRACQRPISGLFLELYLEQQESLFSERGVRLEVAEEILEGAFGRREFLDASVRISTATLALLDEAELSELKQSFSGAIRGAFSELGEQIPYAYLGAIDPTSPTNILEHERDHLKPIPKAVVARGWKESSTRYVTCRLTKLNSPIARRPYPPLNQGRWVRTISKMH